MSLVGPFVLRQGIVALSRESLLARGLPWRRADCLRHRTVRHPAKTQQDRVSELVAHVYCARLSSQSAEPRPVVEPARLDCRLLAGFVALPIKSLPFFCWVGRSRELVKKMRRASIREESEPSRSEALQSPLFSPLCCNLREHGREGTRQYQPRICRSPTSPL